MVAVVTAFVAIVTAAFSLVVAVVTAFIAVVTVTAAFISPVLQLLNETGQELSELTNDACFTATHNADVISDQFQDSALASKHCQRTYMAREQVVPQ